MHVTWSSSALPGPCPSPDRRLTPPPAPARAQPDVRAHGKGLRKLLRQPVPPPDAGAAEEGAATRAGTSLLRRSAWPPGT